MAELVASFFTLTGSGFAEPPRHAFAERCRAAAEAGFAGIGLHSADLHDVPGMQAVLDETGLRVVEIEFLGGWALDGPDDTVVTGIEAVADAFGGRHVSAGEFRAGSLDLDAAAARLAALAAQLDRRGLLIALEAFPWSALPDAGTAAELLRRAGAPNAGLMVDVWHFFNGGAHPDLLADVPIAAVQLNDGPLVHDDFLRHARAERMLPGEGDLDVVGLVRAVRATGFDGPWCVEVNTPEFRALPVDEAAHRAADAAQAVLEAASPPVRGNECSSTRYRARGPEALVLRDGTRLVVRPIRHEDGPALVALHARLSADTIYRRYFGARPHLAPAVVERFTHVDEDWRFALVAVRESGELVAVTRYEGERDGTAAEIAVVVDDALQHQGVGRALLERLVDVATERGLDVLVADVLSANSPMLGLLRVLGLPTRTARDADSTTVTVDLRGHGPGPDRRTRARAHIEAARPTVP